MITATIGLLRLMATYCEAHQLSMAGSHASGRAAGGARADERTLAEEVLASVGGQREAGWVTTINSIAVAMFSVASQDDAISYYTEKLGWGVAADTRWGGDQPGRWVEVAPAGSVARLALNEPMGGSRPGGGSIGVETPDVDAEFARMRAVGGLKLGELIGGVGPVPRMFSVTDPDGNWIWVVQV